MQGVGIAPLIPREVCPEPTAVRACSICTSFPDGLQGTKTPFKVRLTPAKSPQRERARETELGPEGGKREGVLAVPHSRARRLPRRPPPSFPFFGRGKELGESICCQLPWEEEMKQSKERGRGSASRALTELLYDAHRWMLLPCIVTELSTANSFSRDSKKKTLFQDAYTAYV